MARCFFVVYVVVVEVQPHFGARGGGDAGSDFAGYLGEGGEEGGFFGFGLKD